VATSALNAPNPLTPNFCKICGNRWVPGLARCKRCNYQLPNFVLPTQGNPIQSLAIGGGSRNLARQPVNPIMMSIDGALALFAKSFEEIEKTFEDQRVRTLAGFQEESSGIRRSRGYGLVYYSFASIFVIVVSSYFLYPFWNYPWVLWSQGAIYLVVVGVCILKAWERVGHFETMLQPLSAKRDSSLKNLEDTRLRDKREAAKDFHEAALNAIQTLAPFQLQTVLIEALSKSQIYDPNTARIFQNAATQILSGQSKPSP
jgi:hypothetical protein